MGFGTYDESEQQNQDNDIDEEDGVSVHEHDHDGKVEFDPEMSNDELIDQLQHMKDDE
ncbi:DUF5786 family protein [Haloarchaeobius sp. DFWS5]|uniref:DUF5786 family protein n=1 Tax=Haloarchaeobius sp. DFWS5 TaxID=3446114 RepID=UPI003EB8C978